MKPAALAIGCVLGLLVVLSAANPAAGLVRQLRVEVEARTVLLKRAEVTRLGVEPFVAGATVRCDEGEVALAAGASVDMPGVRVLSSLPTGPREYRLELANVGLTNTMAKVSAFCARVLGGPRLTVSTGSGSVLVPSAVVAGTGVLPGTARVTGTCTGGAVPVSSGVDIGDNGALLRVIRSSSSGPRKLQVVLRNFAPEEKEAVVAVRCLDLPAGFDVTRVTVPVPVAAATGAAGAIVPGETEGTKRCPAGKVPVGGGYSGADAVAADTFPTVRSVPVLGYLFRNFSGRSETGSVVVFCTPKVVR